MKKQKVTKLFNKISKSTTKAVVDYNMINDGDRILVGLSGGNDSMVLMHVLYHLQRKAPIKFEVQAVTVNAGFDGIDLDPLAKYCQQMGWKHEIIFFNGKALIEEKGAESNPCALCARVRRGLLHSYADEHGYNKIALGHHLDDICVSMLMSMFHGHGMTTMGPNVPADRANENSSKRLIRPFAYLVKKDIDQVAEELEFPKCGECDYGAYLEENGDRAYLERLVDNLSEKFPGIRGAMLKSMQDVRPEYLLDRKFLSL